MSGYMYSVQEESRRIFEERLIKDEKLSLPPAFADAAKRVSFVGEEPEPFVPTPCKITESASALSALVATAANVVVADRYGIDYQDVEVNTDLATLFLESIALPTVNGKPCTEIPMLQTQFKQGDLYDMLKPIHRAATNVYKTKDGRWYHLHGSLNAGPTMSMMGVGEQDATYEEAIEIYADKVAQNDAEYLEKTANEKFGQAGVTCLTPDEFFASEQGKVMGAEPLWATRAIPAARSRWPKPSGPDLKPLTGIRVIDFSRAIAGPVISKMLALLGAEVIKVTNTNLPDISSLCVDLSTGKKDTDIDLKTDEGTKAFARLVEGADVLVDGYRPGVLARLGFDPEALRKVNERLIYVRENCYGFQGPLSYRSGWQQISDCLVGISWLQGKFLGLDEPVVPLLPNSDYQAGLAGAAAVLKALYERTRNDATYEMDVSLTQYNIWYYRLGQYNEEQSKALLARNEGFHVRHSDDILSLVSKTHNAMVRARPGMFKPEFFWKMEGKEWGLEDDISILVPAFKFEKSKLGYAVPSGSKGRSKPEWSNDAPGDA